MALLNAATDAGRTSRCCLFHNVAAFREAAGLADSRSALQLLVSGAKACILATSEEQFAARSAAFELLINSVDVR